MPISRSSIKKRWPFWTSGLVALLILGGVLYQQTRPTAIPAYKIEANDVVSTLTVTGKVASHISQAVSAPTNAQIIEIPVEEGSVVKAGQILAILEQSELTGAVAEGQARVRESQAALQHVMEGSRPEEIRRFQAQTRFAQGSVGQSRAALAAAQASLAEAQKNAQRFSNLHQQGAISTQEYDQAQTRLESAQADVNRLKATIQSNRASVEEAHQQVLQARNGATQAEINQARASVKASQALLKQAQSRLTDRVIRSQTDGIVTERLQNPGDLAVPGQAILKIANRNTLEIIAQVEEADLYQVHVGAKAYITLDAQPDTPLNATVTKKGSRVNPDNGTVDVTLQVEPTDRSKLLPGMTADVNIITSRLKKALVIPNTAIWEQGKTSYVLLLPEGEQAGPLKLQPVRVKKISAENVQVISGLELGQYISQQVNQAQLQKKGRFVPQVDKPIQPLAGSSAK